MSALFSIDIDDFLEEEIHGPAEFECNNDNKCVFEGIVLLRCSSVLGLSDPYYYPLSLQTILLFTPLDIEPAMNDLIMQMFGDPAIYLKCTAGECLHYTQVPGFARPPRPDYTMAIILSVAGVLLFLICLSLGVYYLAKKSGSSGDGYISLPDDEAAKLMAEHIPAMLMFKQMGYTVGGKDVLRQVSGFVKPGQVMAIMGASGAGKTSLLDILARRHKSGTIHGHIYVNGRTVSSSEYKRVVG